MPVLRYWFKESMEVPDEQFKWIVSLVLRFDTIFRQIYNSHELQNVVWLSVLGTPGRITVMAVFEVPSVLRFLGPIARY